MQKLMYTNVRTIRAVYKLVAFEPLHMALNVMLSGGILRESQARIGPTLSFAM